MRFEPLPQADIPFTLSLRTTVNLLGGLKLSDLPLVLVDLSAPCINHNKQRDKGKYDDQCPRGGRNHNLQTRLQDRMPLILKPESYAVWLDPENKEPGRIEKVLKNGCMQELKRYPVSKLANQVGSTNKECIEQLADDVEEDREVRGRPA